MSKHNRERRKPGVLPSRRGIAYHPILQAERDRITEAAHCAVCEVSRSDGFGKCLMYAVAGFALLPDGYIIQAGTVHIIADPDHDGSKGGHGGVVMDASFGGFERGEYHAWLARPSGSGAEIVDLSSRHYKRYVEEIIPVTSADHEIVTFDSKPRWVKWTREEPPLSVWTTVQTGIARFEPDADTTKAAWKAIGEVGETEELIQSARRHYRYLG